MPPKRHRSPRNRPDPPDRQRYKRSTKSRALANGGLTRTRGSSYGLYRYNRARSSSDGDDSHPSDADGRPDSNADDAVADDHDADEDGGRSSDSVVASNSGESTVVHASVAECDGEQNNDPLVEGANNVNVHGDNVQRDDEGADEDDADLPEIVVVDVEQNLEQVFNGHNNVPNRQVRANVVREDVDAGGDDEVQFGGMDRLVVIYPYLILPVMVIG